MADAYLSGLRGYDIDVLWEAVTKGAASVHPEVSSSGRLGYEYYNELGYVPCDVGINESAARTLEYAYDDWCIYQLGLSLGKTEEEFQYLMSKMFPSMIVGGFTTVTITSVVIAGMFVNLLIGMVG